MTQTKEERKQQKHDWYMANRETVLERVKLIKQTGKEVVSCLRYMV